MEPVTTATISIVLPTYNEAENVPVLVSRLRDVLADVDHEIVVVDDDSPDETWRVAADLDQPGQPVRSIRRVHERGLSSAVVAGIEAATAPTVVVMDADLQHDERIIPALAAAVNDGHDIAVGSREAEGGSYGDFSAPRRLVSYGGRELAAVLLQAPVNDPMSGFFAVSKRYYDGVASEIDPRGFKILLELIARGEPKITEVGYEFRGRHAGETKMSGGIALEFLVALATIATGRLASARFVRYLLVGLSGLLVQLVAFGLLLLIDRDEFWPVATALSILWNYWLDNRWTFAAIARRGAGPWLRGLVVFAAVSVHGLVLSKGIREIWPEGLPWWTAWPVGTAAAAPSNYLLNVHANWRTRFTRRDLRAVAPRN